MRLPQFPFSFLARAALLAILAVPGWALAQSPAPGPTQFLQLPSGRIAYDDTGGDGPLVRAVPGMGDLRVEYRWIRPLLERGGYRVVTMDLRGHGASSAQ